MDQIERALELAKRLLREKSPEYIQSVVDRVDKLNIVGDPVEEYFTRFYQMFDYSQIFDIEELDPSVHFTEASHEIEINVTIEVNTDSIEQPVPSDYSPEYGGTTLYSFAA